MKVFRLSKVDENVNLIDRPSLISSTRKLQCLITLTSQIPFLEHDKVVSLTTSRKEPFKRGSIILCKEILKSYVHRDPGQNKIPMYTNR